MTRADYVEQVIRENVHPGITRKKEFVHEAKTSVVEVASAPLKVATLESLRNQVIVELKLGKQSPGYKAALKALNHFIVVLNSEYTQHF
nr:hypothetical protein [Nostoc sp. LEGE 12447]